MMDLMLGTAHRTVEWSDASDVVWFGVLCGLGPLLEVSADHSVVAG